MRAAILAVAMNLTPVGAVDILRFLRVPAIVMTIRARRDHLCSAMSCRSSRRSSWDARARVSARD